MPKRRNTGRTLPPADVLPEREEVERAIAAALDRLRPGPAATPVRRTAQGTAQAGPPRKPGPRRTDG